MTIRTQITRTENTTMKFHSKLVVPPHEKVRLKDYDPAETYGYEKGHESDQRDEKLMQKTIQRLDELQYTLYAEGKRSLLIILQGMDTAGKDGTIRHVMSGASPQSCKVASFKVPSSHEQAHDFLWRIHEAVPEKGNIGIFNRSHYEDVLVVRVHKLVPKSVWSQRYDEISRFEKYLTENGTTILKFFLHIGKDEQKKRIEDRIANPAKHWKLSPADLKEREFWDNYTEAYEDAISQCSTKYAPWFIIPANHKWFRNLAVSKIVVEALEKMDPQYPTPEVDIDRLKRLLK
jgi:PPK2 family polyphosphate:nucleotide phosphotransferase